MIIGIMIGLQMSHFMITYKIVAINLNLNIRTFKNYSCDRPLFSFILEDQLE